MRARNVFISFITLFVLGWGNVLFADAPVSRPDITATTVNINQADAATLASVLVGVGLRRAEAIVAYREKNGNFYSAEELTAVRGIGKSTIDKNVSKITVQ